MKQVPRNNKTDRKAVSFMENGNHHMIEFCKCEGVVFDLDGTLIDSMWVWEQVDIDFLGNRGFKVPPDYLDAITPMGFEECADYTIKRFHLKETREEVVNEWYSMAIDAYSHRVGLKSGVSEFLAYLSENQVKMSIATASDMQLVRPVLANNHIDKYFDNITTLQEVNRGKSFPDVYHLAVDRMNTDRDKCVVFEDIKEGIMGAKAGGYRAIAVYNENGRDTVETLSEVSDMLIYDFRECIPKK